MCPVPDARTCIYPSCFCFIRRLDDRPPAPVPSAFNGTRLGTINVFPSAEQEDEGGLVTHELHAATGQRSVAMQTAFRDGEAQTEPYSPDFVVPAGSNPEVLKLAHLKAGAPTGKSLPVGHAEIEAVELARRRARTEAALPPATDEAALEVSRRSATCGPARRPYTHY